MDIEVSKKAVELINKDFRGEIFLTYRQYTFNCMCGGGPGEFVKFDKEPCSDHKYQIITLNNIVYNVDEELKPNDKVRINVNDKNNLVITGFVLFDKTKVYNLS